MDSVNFIESAIYFPVQYDELYIIHICLIFLRRSVYCLAQLNLVYLAIGCRLANLATRDWQCQWRGGSQGSMGG
jgi:hypothetical protein